MITAEAINVETSRTTVAGPKRVGRFQLFGDALTKFYENCVNTVSEADDLPKTEVQVSLFLLFYFSFYRSRG
jgi:spondin-1